MYMQCTSVRTLINVRQVFSFKLKYVFANYFLIVLRGSFDLCQLGFETFDVVPTLTYTKYAWQPSLVLGDLGRARGSL